MAKPSILLVAAKWWPLSARMAISFIKNGCSVSAICPIPHPITFVEGLDSIFRYGASNSLACVRKAIQACQPDVVVPCDDGAASQCRALFDGDTSLRPLLERSLGPSVNYATLDSRFAFLEVAERLGLHVPKTCLIGDRRDLIAWHGVEGGSAVLKVNGESGGNGVRICRSLEESAAAFELLRVAPSQVAALKRVIIDKDPLAPWLRRRPREITIQKYIDGRPANTMVAAWRGRVLALMSVAVVAADGPTGAATIVRVINDERMRHSAELIAARLHMSGFFGLDFVVATTTNIPYLIEINPRCTQLGHIELARGRSLAQSFVRAIRGVSSPEIFEAASSERIALFPQAARFQSVVAESYHDKPSGYPKLIRELVRRPWPQRQLISRAYHIFNPVKVQAPSVFEELNVSRSTEGGAELMAVRPNAI